MMIKYKVGYYLSAEITEVEVERETAESVWVNGRRHKKGGHFFDTWEAAHSHLMERADEKLSQARRSLQSAQCLHGNIKGMEQ